MEHPTKNGVIKKRSNLRYCDQLVVVVIISIISEYHLASAEFTEIGRNTVCPLKPYNFRHSMHSAENTFHFSGFFPSHFDPLDPPCVWSSGFLHHHHLLLWHNRFRVHCFCCCLSPDSLVTESRQLVETVISVFGAPEGDLHNVTAA